MSILYPLGNEFIRGAAAPKYGGSLAQFEFKKGNDWFPMFQDAGSEELLASGLRAFFVMCPTTGYTRDGSILYNQASFSLGSFPQPHAADGYGPLGCWEVQSYTSDVIELFLFTSGQKHPYPSELKFTLRYSFIGKALVVRFSATNVGKVVSPVAGGSQPLILQKVCGDNLFQLQFSAESHYARDAEIPNCYIPTGVVEPLSGALDYSTMKLGKTGADSTYGGWNGKAEALWKKARVKLKVSVTDGPHDLIHYSKSKTRPVWSLQPLLGIADGINLFAKGVENTGVAWLKPNAEIQWEHRFEVDVLA